MFEAARGRAKKRDLTLAALTFQARLVSLFNSPPRGRKEKERERERELATNLRNSNAAFQRPAAKREIMRRVFARCLSVAFIFFSRLPGRYVFNALV